MGAPVLGTHRVWPDTVEQRDVAALVHQVGVVVELIDVPVAEEVPRL